MEIEILNERNRAEWDDFCLKSPSAWFRHTSAWSDYSRSCRFDSNSVVRSFMVKQGNTILAIVPLMSEYAYACPSKNCFAMYGDYTPVPAFNPECEVNPKSILGAIDDQLRIVAQQDNVSFGRFFIDPLIEADYFRDFIWFNKMTGGGGGGAASVTSVNIADLSLPEDVVLRKMRKGHKAAIKSAMKESSRYQIDFFDQSNIEVGRLMDFKAIHRVDAGRQTRTDQSWMCMFDWISQGHAILALYWSVAEKRYAAGAFIITYKGNAYYGSFATLDSNLLEGRAGYAIQWEIMRYLKSHGITKYNLGANVCSHDQKLLDIAKYKRGFMTVEYPQISFDVDYTEVLP